MPRLAAIAVLAALTPGCITGVGLYKHQENVSVPMIIGAAAADLVVIALLASQADSLSAGASIVTGVAGTALDFGVACVLGTCQVLHP